MKRRVFVMLLLAGTAFAQAPEGTPVTSIAEMRAVGLLSDQGLVRLPGGSALSVSSDVCSFPQDTPTTGCYFLPDQGLARILNDLTNRLLMDGWHLRAESTPPAGEHGARVAQEWVGADSASSLVLEEREEGVLVSVEVTSAEAP